MLFRLILRTRLVSGSAKYRFPALSKREITGDRPRLGWPARYCRSKRTRRCPRIVAIGRGLALTMRITQLPLIGDVHVSGCVDGHGGRAVQFGERGVAYDRRDSRACPLPATTE